MKIRLIAVLGIALVLAFAGYWNARRPPTAASPKSIEKALASAAKRGAQRAQDCESFFSEWDALMKGQSELEDKRLQLLSDQAGRYPGIPASTLSVWKILATQMPTEGEIDVSFAFGLSDCQYFRYTKTASKLLTGSYKLDPRRSAARRLGGSVFGVLREVLERPLSRQALWESVSLLRAMNQRGWVHWEAGDGMAWESIFESLSQFNARLDVREKEMQQKVFKAPNFKAINESDRKGIVTQLRYSFVETEAARQRLLPLLARIVVPHD